MALPKGIPTLQHMATGRWSRPDNVFLSEDAFDLMVSCDTAPSLRGPGTDHMPIHTELDFSLTRVQTDSFRNFCEMEWDKFCEELSAQLCLKINDADTFHRTSDGLTTVIHRAIEKKVPLSKPCPHSRRWWTKELSESSKTLNRLSEVSYRH
ncbi:hypothetical protein GGF50DRAFT_26445, partial [Schizophyllum commune]